MPRQRHTWCLEERKDTRGNDHKNQDESKSFKGGVGTKKLLGTKGIFDLLIFSTFYLLVSRTSSTVASKLGSYCSGHSLWLGGHR